MREPERRELDPVPSDGAAGSRVPSAILPGWVVRWRRLALAAADAVAWIIALAMATATRLSIADSDVAWGRVAALVASAALLQVIGGYLVRLNLGAYRIGSVDEATTVVNVWAGVSSVIIVVNYLLLGRPVPTLAVLLSLPLALCLMLGVRFAWRLLYARVRRPSFAPHRRRVIVFGAGEGGEQIVRAMVRDPDSEYVAVALLDDDPSKGRRSIFGVPVRGTREDLARVARATEANGLLIAIPSASTELVGELDTLGRQAGLEVRVLPSTTELLRSLRLGDIRELTDVDLLGRTEVEVDLEGIKAFLVDQRVLVTGAGGSIGSELCRQIDQLGVGELHMLDRDESALQALQLSLEGRALLDTDRLIVCDIRDREAVDELFDERPFDIVFHAAALKHLVLLERYPNEAAKTNVGGTSALLDAALRTGVQHFVNVSTDKAADPTSVLGASKLAAEQLTARAAISSGRSYVSVRFGNVLGSRGSVLPIFREQIAAGGPVTVTHPEATRYFMTIPEAVRLVLQAAVIGAPGETMVLDMGQPVRIAELAERLIRHSGRPVEIQYTGLRDGEKLHETMVGLSELGVTREHPRITHVACQPDLGGLVAAAAPGPAGGQRDPKRGASTSGQAARHESRG